MQNLRSSPTPYYYCQLRRFEGPELAGELVSKVLQSLSPWFARRENLGVTSLVGMLPAACKFLLLNVPYESLRWIGEYTVIVLRDLSGIC